MNVWLPNGTSFITMPTLGNLLDANFRIVMERFSFDNSLPKNYYLFSQAGSTAEDREFGLFFNNLDGSVQLFYAGTSNVTLVADAETFFNTLDGSVDGVKFDFEIDLSTGDWSVSIDEVLASSGSVSVVTTRRIDGMLFRVGARGDDDTPGSTSGSFTPPAGAVKVGDFEVYVNGVLVRNYVMPSGTETTIPDLENEADATLQSATGDGSDWESTAPNIEGVSGLQLDGTVTITVGQHSGESLSATANGVSLSDVTATNATTLTATVPGSIGASIGSSVDVVVTDSVGSSEAYAAELGAPAGYSYVALASIADGSAADQISGIAVPDQIVHEDPAGGQDVDWTDDGELDLPGASPGVYEISYFVLDASDNYSRGTTGVITIDAQQPQISSVTVESDGVTITVEFTEAVAAGSDGAGGVTVGGYACVYDGGDGTSTWTFTSASPIYDGQEPSAAYTQPGDGIQDAVGNLLATTSGLSVDNQSTQALAPTISNTSDVRMGETVTVTTDGAYATITALTLAGVDVMPVTEINSTSFSFECPQDGVGVPIKSNADLVATTAGGDSEPFPVQILPRVGWDSVVLEAPFLFDANVHAGYIIEWESEVEYNSTTYNPVALANGRIDFDGSENGIPFNFRVFNSNDYTPSEPSTLLRNDEPATYIFDDLNDAPINIPPKWHYSNIVSILDITVPVDAYIVRDDGGQVHFRENSSAPWGPWYEVGDPAVSVEHGWQAELRVKNSDQPSTQTGVRLYVDGYSNGFEITTGTVFLYESFPGISDSLTGEVFSSITTELTHS